MRAKSIKGSSAEIIESELNESLKDGFYYRIHLLLNRRLGSFWKLNGLYEFSRQRTGFGGFNTGIAFNLS